MATRTIQTVKKISARRSHSGLSQRVASSASFFILGILFVILVSCFARAQMKAPQTEIDNRERWKAIAPYIKEHFKTDMTIEEIAAELAYQEYLMQKEK